LTPTKRITVKTFTFLVKYGNLKLNITFRLPSESTKCKERSTLPKTKGKTRTALTKEEDKQVINIYAELEDLRKRKYP
jgi:hypothetical protein